MGPIEWSRRFLDSTRGRLVARLRQGPATVEELAGGVGLTDNGVRVHLATLERDGWIAALGVRRSETPGKPATLYALTPEAPALLSTAYRPLLVALLGALAETEPPARVKALIRRAGRRLAKQLGDGGAGGVEERALRLLEALGAAAEVDRRGKGRFVIRGLGCPVGDAVAVEPALCRSISALLADALQVPVEERCDRSGAPRCRFEVGRGVRPG